MSGVRAAAAGVFGVFLVLLGGGLALDGDWFWRGGAVVAAGAALLAASLRRNGTS